MNKSAETGKKLQRNASAAALLCSNACFVRNCLIWKRILETSLALNTVRQILIGSDLPTRTMLLVFILSLCEDAALTRVTCDNIAALGKDARRYCFGRPASYQRVRMAAVFPECEEASVYLAPGGALRSIDLDVAVQAPP